MSNIVLGIGIDILVHLAMHFQVGPVVNLQNYGLDVMTRLNHTVCALAPPTGNVLAALRKPLKCPGTDGSYRPPLLVEIDTETWRSENWGGGEPDRAPLGRVADLVQRAFELGAQQVVLDILIEDKVGSRAPEASGSEGDAVQESARRVFADRLKKLQVEHGRRLVLVRSERRPLPGEESAFLGEMRSSAAVDRAARELAGRVVVAAPYFEVGADHVTRDWDLFRVVCQRRPDQPDVGHLRVEPSVQLVTKARAVSDAKEPHSPLTAIFEFSGLNVFQPAGAALAACMAKSRTACDCAPMPLNGVSGLTAQEMETRSQVRMQSADHIAASYWRSVQNAFASTHKLGDLPHPGALGNRIIFRLGPESSERLPIAALGDVGASRSDALEHTFNDRVVVIGQTHDESGDFFETPLGRMPGALLLANAIDSMEQYGMVKAPASWVTLLTSFVLVVVVGYLFARWSSAVAKFLATLTVILTAGVASFFLIAHGVWLNFVAPIVGIYLHNWWAEWEEHRELARLRAMDPGGGH